MPVVVLDRSIVVPAACSSTSKYRALLVMLEYGRLCSHVRFGGEEKELAEQEPGAVFGGPSIDSLIDRAADSKAGLEGHLGYPPDGWEMVGSKQLLDAYAESIRNNQERFGLALEPIEVLALRTKLLCTCAHIVPDDRMLPVYPFTDDHAVNVLLTTATQGGAPFIITADKALQRKFTHPETKRTVQGIDFDAAAEMITTSSFEFAAVNPRLW